MVEARAGAEPVRLTTTPEGEGGRPAWSPDGSRIAILVGDNDQNTAYGMNKLAVVPANRRRGRQRRVSYTASLDRAVSSPSWSADGSSISFLLQDDRTKHVATVPAEGPSTAPGQRHATRHGRPARHSAPRTPGRRPTATSRWWP